MEGPTGVMKQLHALWNILELTDREIFGHLLRIGAESLHFAFRMLLVLFRRELSFGEVLCMWEVCSHWLYTLLFKCPWVYLSKFIIRLDVTFSHIYLTVYDIYISICAVTLIHIADDVGY